SRLRAASGLGGGGGGLAQRWRERLGRAADPPRPQGIGAMTSRNSGTTGANRPVAPLPPSGVSAPSPLVGEGRGGGCKGGVPWRWLPNAARGVIPTPPPTPPGHRPGAGSPHKGEGGSAPPSLFLHPLG